VADLVQLKGLLDFVSAGLRLVGCAFLHCQRTGGGHRSTRGHGTEVVGHCEIEGDDEEERPSHVVVFLYGLGRDSDRSLVDVAATHVLADGTVHVFRDLRTVLGIVDASFEAAVVARATAQHAFIGLFSGKPQSLGERKNRSVIVTYFDAQCSAVVQFLRI